MLQNNNQDLEFNDLAEDVQNSFLNQRADKKLYPVGTTLIRVVTLGENSFSGRFCIKQADFENIKRYAELKRVSLQSATREMLALLTKFSSNPDLATTITLCADMYGFEGPAGVQIDRGNKEILEGGCTQIFIPNLTKEQANGQYNKVGLHHKFN